MENFIQNEINFEDENLNTLVQCLNEQYKKRQNNFAEFCVCVAKIYYYCKENYYRAKNDEYYNAITLLGKFGFGKATVFKMISCYEKFMLEDNKSLDVETNLKSIFFPFSSSKLFELVSISNDQLFSDIDKKILKPEMTVKEIREYVKNLKGGAKIENKVLEDSSTLESDEDEEPSEEFFTVKKVYELEFFENCTQKQLVAIAYTLQTEYQNLLAKSNSKKIKK